MKKNLPICAIIVVGHFLRSFAGDSFDWSAHIDDLDGFIKNCEDVYSKNYTKYKEAKSRYEAVTQSITCVSASLTAIDQKDTSEYPVESLSIGEFESTEEYQARVEKHRRQAELRRKEFEKQRKKNKQVEKLKLEKEKERLMEEAQKCLNECNEFAVWALELTNRLQNASVEISKNDLPYFDRDSMSFKDIRNPFYQREGNYNAKAHKIKFVVNAEKTDFDSVSMPKNLSSYRYYESWELDGKDSFTCWQKEKHRMLNVNVDKTVTLKFKRFSDAKAFKMGILVGDIKAWFVCAFKVGFSADWIIRQGYYEPEKLRGKGYEVLNVLFHGVDSDTYYTGRGIWHPAITGKIVPINILASKIIIEGESVESMDVEIVSPTGIWSVEKRNVR